MDKSKQIEFMPVHLKDEKILSDFALPADRIRRVADRKNLLRYFTHCYYWENEKNLALAFIQEAHFHFTGHRAFIYAKKALNSKELRKLLSDLFKRHSHYLDLELIFCEQGPVASGDFRGLNVDFSENTYVEDSNGHLKRAVSCRVSRFHVLTKSIFIPAKNFALIVSCDDREDVLVRSAFIRNAEPVEDLSTKLFLTHLGVLDPEGRYDANLAASRAQDLMYPELLLEAERQIREYLSGNRRAFELPLKVEQGTDFQNKTWRALQDITYGSAISYEELASHVIEDGEEARYFARAVGNACGRNPLVIFVPCHRVIGKQGDLVGFTGGVDIKSQLLNLELFNYEGFTG